MEIKNGRPGKLELKAKTMLRLTNQKLNQCAPWRSRRAAQIASDGAYS
jgi:hypothetical protein